MASMTGPPLPPQDISLRLSFQAPSRRESTASHHSNLRYVDVIINMIINHVSFTKIYHSNNKITNNNKNTILIVELLEKDLLFVE